MKNVGKPCKREAYARIDGGRLETERRPRSPRWHRLPGNRRNTGLGTYRRTTPPRQSPTLLRTAPEELTSTADFANPFAGGPEAPVEIHVAFDHDDPELAAKAIDPIRQLGTVIDDDVALKPYADTLMDGATPPPGIHIMSRSAFVDKESVPEVLQILAEVGASERSPFIAVRSVGGAVSRVPDDATAYPHRQAELMFVTTTAGPKPVVDAARPSLEAIWGSLAPHVNGAYANFLTSASEEDVAAIYPTDTYQRLAAVKRQYDPGNLFARNHNVRPQ